VNSDSEGVTLSLVGWLCGGELDETEEVDEVDEISSVERVDNNGVVVKGDGTFCLIRRELFSSITLPNMHNLAPEV
jgi:hypothetical protein